MPPPRTPLFVFLRQCWRELRKVAWSSRRSLVNNAILVFMSLTLVVVALGAVDVGLGTLVRDVLR